MTEDIRQDAQPQDAQPQDTQPEQPPVEQPKDVDVEHLQGLVLQSNLSEEVKDELAQGLSDLAARAFAGDSADDEEALSQMSAVLEQVQRDLQYAQAEVQNISRRAESEVAKALLYGQERLLSELLGVLDNMHRALESLSGLRDDSAGIATGIELTAKSLTDTLDKFGLKKIDAHGAAFDPERHEALSYAPSPDATPDTIIEVIQTGYTLHDRVLRPARVIIASRPAEAKESAQEERTATPTDSQADAAAPAPEGSTPKQTQTDPSHASPAASKDAS
ncbi:MAG: nucleotide exchange factor GrpE [Gammaproteobacteria bacterium AqS3]|nr:nucleotide exchange factor GrpE [Gammaproteobacteria bacterium AqS3]